MLGGRPVQPITNRVLTTPGAIAHGVLMLGGSFTDLPQLRPVGRAGADRRHHAGP